MIIRYILSAVVTVIVPMTYAIALTQNGVACTNERATMLLLTLASVAVITAINIGFGIWRNEK